MTGLNPVSYHDMPNGKREYCDGVVLFLNVMEYDSLSTVIVAVIVLLGIAVWLPLRTSTSMKQVLEHRADKFSTSLHLVDEHSGTRFSDGRTHMEGVGMQPNTRRPGVPTAERIAQVRSLRRAAIRRRRIIVVTLALVTVGVLVCAFSLRFSPLYALIPAAALGIVLALGVHASRQAREWEHELSLARKRAAGNKTVTDAQKRAIAERKAKQKALADHKSQRAVEDQESKTAENEPPTYEMEQREIRQVLHKAQMEQRKALQEHAAQKNPEPQAQEPVQEQSKTIVEAAEKPLPEPHSESEVTREAGSQDLISFSLGAPRESDASNAETVEDPQSLEIKSARQVAKAEPVDTEERKALAAEAKMETVPASEAKQSDGDEKAMNAADAESQTSAIDSFHKAEQEAQVAVPAATSDSLGNGLEEILARRVAAK